ncbi:MAG: archease [Ignavibacteria bacterium]
MTYRFLDHTADIGIEVIAPDLKQAFIEAIFGLLELIFNKSFKEFDIKNGFEILEIVSNDLESLFVDTLNEVLFLIDSRKIIPLKPEIIVMSNNTLKLKYNPMNFDYSKFPMQMYVKAVTYHQLKINQSNKLTTIKFYLDI